LILKTWHCKRLSRNQKIVNVEDDVDGSKSTLPWIISYAVFGAVILLASISGTTQYAYDIILTSLPWQQQHSAPEIVFSIAWVAFTLVNYYIVFPRITNQHKRPFSLFSYVFMGLVMGVCDSLVLTASYRIINWLPISFSAVKFIAFVLLYMAPTAYYYAAIFNPILAPVHRRPEYDLYKILTLSLSDILACVFLFIWEGGFLVFTIQALVLGGIVGSMRFPAPWYRQQDNYNLPSVNSKRLLFN
jgi:hypothetical protein